MIKQSFNLLRLAIKSSNKSKFIGLLATVIVFELFEIFIIFKLNGVRGDLYQAIQDYKPELIWLAIEKFVGYAFVLVFSGGYLGFFINRLSFFIRRGLTAHFLENGRGVAAEASLFGQRIQEDLRNFGEQSVTFWLAVFRASLKFPLFVGLVVSLTQWYVGLTLVIAVIIGTYLTGLVSRKLVVLQAEQESNEADFRSKLSTLAWARVAETFFKINKAIKVLSFTQSGLQQGFVLMPFILLLPLYIAKTIALGPFFRATDALGKVIDSLVVLIDNRQLIVGIQSTLKRIETLSE